jgi:hypothetical protein
MGCEPPAITFIPCEAHFRPVLPTIEGNVDYLALRGQLITMDELLRTSGVETEFVTRSLQHWVTLLSQSKVEQIALSGEGKGGVIRLEELLRGQQQARFQAHSIQALRCTLARTLLGGSFRDFAARLADSPLLQWFCQVGQLDRVKVPSKSMLQRYANWLPEEPMREVTKGLLRHAGAARNDGKQALDLEEPLELSTMYLDSTCVKANIHFPTDWVQLARRRQEPDAVSGTHPHARAQIPHGRAASLYHEGQSPLDGNDPDPAQEGRRQSAQAGVAGDEAGRDGGAWPCPALPHVARRALAGDRLEPPSGRAGAKAHRFGARSAAGGGQTGP